MNVPEPARSPDLDKAVEAAADTYGEYVSVQQERGWDVDAYEAMRRALEAALPHLPPAVGEIAEARRLLERVVGDEPLHDVMDDIRAFLAASVQATQTEEVLGSRLERLEAALRFYAESEFAGDVAREALAPDQPPGVKGGGR